MALAYLRSLSVPLASMIAMFMASKLISAIVKPAMIAAKSTRPTHSMMYIQKAGEQPEVPSKAVTIVRGPHIRHAQVRRPALKDQRAGLDRNNGIGN